MGARSLTGRRCGTGWSEVALSLFLVPLIQSHQKRKTLLGNAVGGQGGDATQETYARSAIAKASAFGVVSMTASLADLTRQRAVKDRPLRRKSVGREVD
jgi:hypothetical protein